ncbi:ATP-binding protein [Candidatus Magnetomoraceae bacterium gMMP-1]
MSKIPFTVSARTARLIGRENVANAEGAIIELVKNSYDADAKLCILFFTEKYNQVPSELSFKEYKYLSKKQKNIAKYYFRKKLKYSLDETLRNESLNELKAFLSNFRELYIIDNGDGMDDSIIKEDWMTIGTNFKQKNIFTKTGRIRSGSKGIGRFALDRLGSKGEMITKPKGKNILYDWNVNWKDFEVIGAKINEIQADLSEFDSKDYFEKLNEIIQDKNILNLISEDAFQHGTTLKISCLRDDWNEKSISNLFNSLEILTPPNNEKKFKILLFDSTLPGSFGEVDTTEYDDFDYKIVAEYLNDDQKNINIHLQRNEINFDFLDKDVFKYPEMQIIPYDKKTLQNNTFQLNRTVYDLLPGIKDKPDIETKLSDLGKFKFTFYFLKNSIGGKEDREKYFYKEFNSRSRSNWFSKFGGIRIFRDEFRVRPFGEINNSAYDWLFLGERQAKSPAAVSRIGHWKVRPNQIAGSLKISRLLNQTLQDKSSREGLQENESFELLKNILLNIIKKFEKDRSTIAHYLDKLYKEKKYFEEEKRKASEIIKKESKNGEKNNKEKNRKELSSELETFKKGFKKQEEELQEKNKELMQLRALASTGIVVTSFSHEFERISNKLHTRTTNLRNSLNKIISKEILSSLQRHHDPFYQIEKIEKQDEQIKHWIDFSLAKIKKDKRKRKQVDIVDYFNQFKQTWEPIVHEKGVSIMIKDNNVKVSRRIFFMDFDTIFENLLTNSLESFNRPGIIGDRKIIIELKNYQGYFEVLYKDNGEGLAYGYQKNPYKIFEFGETSKRDATGKEIGTGLGMWLLKSIVEEYNGNISFLTEYSGFGLKIKIDKQRY